MQSPARSAVGESRKNRYLQMSRGHNRRVNPQDSAPVLRPGDRVAIGRAMVEVTEEFAASLEPGDEVLAVGSRGILRRIPVAVARLVDGCLGRASAAFEQLAGADMGRIDAFFESAATRLESDSTFEQIRAANEQDVERARRKGRGTTRLVLSDRMRSDMVEALLMWRGLPAAGDRPIGVVEHPGWSVEEWRAPLGVIGFVFEGRPNVFADATGVLKGRNTAVFRIGSDALGTAKALMEHVVTPALVSADLPESSVVLVESEEHAAGWAMFADSRLSLAVARGSGDAVAELGAIARQAGTAASLHGTGGAWVLVGERFDSGRLGAVVEHSLDRKVCNTMNVICVPAKVARDALSIIWVAAHAAAERRGTRPRIHAVNGAQRYLPESGSIDVKRAPGVVQEPQVTPAAIADLATEFEWEENPEFHVVVVDSMDEAVGLFNMYSPRFIASIVSSDRDEFDDVWKRLNSPFVGDGFTRWVDGQFALGRPELGLSNWQFGRLFARGGILSGDSAFTVRLRMNQVDESIHR